MASIAFQPFGRVVTARAGESIFDAGRRAGIPIPTSCTGRASCGLCRVKILGGEAALSPFGHEETPHLGNSYFISKLRLSCQARILTDDAAIEVAVPNVASRSLPNAPPRGSIPAMNPGQNGRATRFLAACRGEPVDTTPVWIMRQAGRYLPEYKKTRERAGSFLALCKTPDLACEVTLQPVERLGVDAAILFSDILIPLEAMGIPLSFSDAGGPSLEPVRSRAAIDRLRVPEAEESMGFVMQAIRLIRGALAGKVPLIGFAGAPWTLLSYAVEGRTGKNFADSRGLLYSDPATAHALLDKITATTIGYLAAQIRAGAEAVQLFDSWAGALGPEEYRTFALPYVKKIVAAVRRPGVPFIYFCNEGATLLADAATAGADVLGVDYRVPLDQARAWTGDRAILQGNLDPCALFAPPATIERLAADVIRRAGRRHVFNLGHGILPPTPVEHAQALVEAVHRLGARP